VTQTKVTVKLSSKGAVAILKSSPVSAMVMQAAEQYAAALGGLVGSDIVEVRQYDGGDRVAVGVAIAHPKGKALQAKTGALTRAAAMAGLTVANRK